MTLPRILFLIAVVTFSVCLYVHEQVSKVILLYEIQHYQKERVVLDDTHDVLRYQVSALQSPRSLESLLAKRNVLLDLPADHKVVRVAMRERKEPLPTKQKNFLEIFSTTKVAEAGSR
ncbi:MAG: hypothetical protein HY590_00895 [Candidatus Omnitrophica bacterium]|nr:hypothetical protein [Candidatus Omnitrophota bacterium]